MELVEKAKEGDHKAFEILAKTCNSRLMQAIEDFNIVPHEREDLLQEIRIKIWKELIKYRGKSSFQMWARRIAIIHCVNHLCKKNPLRSSSPLDAPLEENEECSIP